MTDRVPPSIRTRLTERKVLQWALAYLAGAWVLLQVIALLAEPFGWPELHVVRTATVVLAVLFLAALVIAWYHGEHGHQRVSASEAGLLAIVVSAAIASGLIAWRSVPSATTADGQTGAAEPNSIAVLPFDDLSPQRDQGYFSDGITEIGRASCRERV